jgi:hypothetical protein
MASKLILQCRNIDTRTFLYDLTHLQVPGSTGVHNECSTVRPVSGDVINDVFCRLLCCHGNETLSKF